MKKGFNFIVDWLASLPGLKKIGRDKIAHFMVFYLLFSASSTVMTYLSIRVNLGMSMFDARMAWFVGFSVLGTLKEIIWDGYMSKGQFDFKDILANEAGLILSWGMFILFGL